MFAKTFTIAALAAAASAQSSMMNLTALLNSTPQLSNLTTYLALYPDLVSTLSAATNVTLVAPNNAAFAAAMNSSYGAALAGNQTALVEALFSYHVLQGTYYASNITTTPAFPTTLLAPTTNDTLLQPGAAVEAVMVGNETRFISGLLGQSTVTSANHNFTGGVLHIVDSFLTLPQNISSTLVPLNLTYSAGAIKKANLAASASSISNLTAFIPNNAAWQSISNIASNLTATQLQQTLGYHLVADTVAYSSMLTNMSLTTLAMTNLTITIVGNDTFVNNAKVVTPNVIIQEGVLHVIDEVLNPMNATFNSAMESKTMPAYASATSGVKVPFTSGIPAPTVVPAGATASGGAAGATNTAAAGGSGSSGSSSSSSGFAMPMQTAALGAAALFGGAAVILNL